MRRREGWEVEGGGGGEMKGGIRGGGGGGDGGNRRGGGEWGGGKGKRSADRDARLPRDSGRGSSRERQEGGRATHETHWSSERPAPGAGPVAARAGPHRRRFRDVRPDPLRDRGDSQGRPLLQSNRIHARGTGFPCSRRSLARWPCDQSPEFPEPYPEAPGPRLCWEPPPSRRAVVRAPCDLGLTVIARGS